MGSSQDSLAAHMLRHLPELTAYVQERRNSLSAPPTPSLAQPYKPRHKWPSDRTGKAAIQLTYDLHYQAITALMEALSKLTIQEQKILLLRFVHGRSLAAIGEEVGISTQDLGFVIEDLVVRMDREVARRVSAAKKVAPDAEPLEAASEGRVDVSSNNTESSNVYEQSSRPTSTNITSRRMRNREADGSSRPHSKLQTETIGAQKADKANESEASTNIAGVRIDFERAAV